MFDVEIQCIDPLDEQAIIILKNYTGWSMPEAKEFAESVTKGTVLPVLQIQEEYVQKFIIECEKAGIVVRFIGKSGTVKFTGISKTTDDNQSIKSVESEVKFCYNCGTKVSEGALFCHKCGVKIVQKDAIGQRAVISPASASLNVTEMMPEDIVKPGDLNAAEQRQQVPNTHAPRTATTEDDMIHFKKYVDRYVQANTKFQSAEDLIRNSKPLMFVWPCIGILSIIGIVLGGSTGWLTGLLVFGGFFGYSLVFIVSGIIRGQYRAKFSGVLDCNINPDQLLLFLNEHLRYLSPYFHECGYLQQRGGLLATIDNAVSKAFNEVNLCCEFGPKKKSLATICIKPNTADSGSVQVRFFVGAVRSGFLIDGRAAGFLGHACLIKTAPILHAAMEYYSKCEYMS